MSGHLKLVSSGVKNIYNKNKKEKKSINQSVNGSNNSISNFTITKMRITTIYTLIY